MRFIKLLIISVVVIFLLLTAFSSLLPSTVRISRAIDISEKPSRIMEELSNMQKWNEWNEYTKTLTDKQVTTDSIHSALLSVSVTSSTASTITTNWHQQNRPSFPGVFNLTAGRSFTTVQWYFEFHLKWYPWEKFASIIYDKELGPEMQESLQNLKILIEKAP
jgi:hypothetical protein